MSANWRKAGCAVASQPSNSPKDGESLPHIRAVGEIADEPLSLELGYRHQTRRRAGLAVTGFGSRLKWPIADWQLKTAELR
jgi:hypothetical protein